MQRKSFGNMQCPIARSLERVGEWWSILVLRDALHGLMRFDEFQQSLGIAPNMLTRRLNGLVDAGLLERRRYSERPPRGTRAMSVAAIGETTDPGGAAKFPSVDHGPRTKMLLHGPIVPTLLRMAWPNVLVMLAQAASGLIETWFVSKLGTDALAGMALVFPGVMLVQMISAGAMGGGISSAVARALGGGRRQGADGLRAPAPV